MKLAYFPGCKIDFYLKDYGISFKSIMKKLSVELVELPFNCCGYPARSKDFDVSIFSSIRNFAMARKHDLDIITPCMCCYGQLKYASFQWKQLGNQIGNFTKKPSNELKHEFTALLAKEDLFWDGKTKIKHLLPFLYNDIGITEIKRKIKKRLPEKRVVTQYGCHALRPFTVTGFDNPHVPQIFEELINITGLKSIEWSKSTECCGNPIYESNKKLSLKLLHSKLNAAIKVKADYICTACTHCQIQYSDLPFQKECETHNITPTLFTQILDTVL
ncbi:MAG: heterodisulfide reductase [Desulfobacula sp.]|nr:heterodisulfide reductase [Desulfobacula sp.]